MDPLTLSLISSGIGVAAGYAQYRKGQKEANRLDELGMESMAEATLPEFRDVEAKYRQISETGLGAAEVNEFKKRAQTSMYAQQMGAQTMAGGSLARYTLAMNNANYLNQMGILAGQQFQRRMQGLTGLERRLGMRQARTDADIQMENQRRLAAGQAAAALSAQGLQNIVGGISSVGTFAAYSAMGGDGTKTDKISDPNYGIDMEPMALRQAGTVPVSMGEQSPIMGPTPPSSGLPNAGKYQDWMWEKPKYSWEK